MMCLCRHTRLRSRYFGNHCELFGTSGGVQGACAKVALHVKPEYECAIQSPRRDALDHLSSYALSPRDGLIARPVTPAMKGHVFH